MTWMVEWIRKTYTEKEIILQIEKKTSERGGNKWESREGEGARDKESKK